MTKELKVLYMQIREDKETCLEEFLSFVRYSKLKEENFTILNVFDTPKFDSSIIKDHHALFVGGSSDASVLKRDVYTFVDHCCELMKHCAEQDIPVFASCFGFQIACEALGGKVIEDVEGMEMGAYPIIHSDHTVNDILFSDVPNNFTALVGHRERAHILPENAISLGSTEKCPCQAFKIKDKNFYAFQYHPELDVKDMVARLERYCSRYPFEKLNGVKSIIDSLEKVNTDHSNNLLEKFVERILKK
eukprot:gene5015-8613_t